MGTNVLLPKNSFAIKRGASKSLKLFVNDLSEEAKPACLPCSKCNQVEELPPFDLTGHTAYFSVRREEWEEDALIVKISTSALQIQVVDAKAGQARVFLVPADTYHLDPGFYVFDVWVVLSTGERLPVLEGQMQLETGVTRIPL